VKYPEFVHVHVLAMTGAFLIGYLTASLPSREKWMVFIGVVVMGIMVFLFSTGCASPNDCRVTIDPDWKNGSISYYWPGQPGTPGPDSTTLDCRERRTLPLD